MNASEVVMVYKLFRLFNRKWFVTEARLARAIGKTPAIQAVKSVEDSFHVSIEKLEQGYHMESTEAKKPAPRAAKKTPAKKAAKKVVAKKAVAKAAS